MYEFRTLQLNKQFEFDFTKLTAQQEAQVNERLQEIEPFVKEYFELTNRVSIQKHKTQGLEEVTVRIKKKSRGSLVDQFGVAALRFLEEEI